MYTLANLSPAKGSKKRAKRIGRGNASGSGTYSGRGMKGQKARSGGRRSSPIEGGRTPLMQQTPKKRGFVSIRPKAKAVNLRALEQQFTAGATVDKSALRAAGMIEGRERAKILGMGKITKALHLKGLKVSATAKAAIEQSGGSVVE